MGMSGWDGLRSGWRLPLDKWQGQSCKMRGRIEPVRRKTSRMPAPGGLDRPASPPATTLGDASKEQGTQGQLAAVMKAHDHLLYRAPQGAIGQLAQSGLDQQGLRPEA